MEEVKNYENYPVGIVIFSNLVSITIYGLGFVIIAKLGLIFSILYLIFISILEYRLLRQHCTNCYYWGKRCGFGKGRVSSLFFKRGDPSKFCEREISWKEMIPDLLVSVIPVIIGIVLLILEFDFVLLAGILLLILLSTAGNGYIRGTLTCKYCKQREIGCPADNLFNKDK
jgi:hypothetical protein